MVVAAVLAVCAPACFAGTPDPKPNDTFGACHARPGTRCIGQDLQGVSLVAADLHGADLSRSNLEGADLTNADLRGVDLTRANLAGAHLAKADLRGANLAGSVLYGADMTDALAEGMNTQGAKVCGLIRSDGSVDLSRRVCGTEPTTPPNRSPITSGPPQIITFAPAKPVRCDNDVAGTSVTVDISTRRVFSSVVRLDGVEAAGTSTANARLRVPFVCDGRPHALELFAIGSAPPVARARITLSLLPESPPAP